MFSTIAELILQEFQFFLLSRLVVVSAAFLSFGFPSRSNT